MVESRKEPTSQAAAPSGAVPPSISPVSPTEPAAESAGERVRRKRRREPSKKRSALAPRELTSIIWHWMSGILGVLAILFVLVMRFWWVVFVVLGVVLLLGAMYRLRSKKKRRPVPWMKLAVIGGVSASIATIGPVIALRAGGASVEREGSGALDAPLDLPGSFEATLSGLQLLVVDFVLATIGIVLLTSALAHRLRSRRASDD